MKLKNKSVIVTGAGSGVGKAISILFAKEGAKLILSGRRVKPLVEVKKIIERDGGNANFYTFDVSNKEQVVRNFDKILMEHPKIDILINNAGILDWGPINKMSFEKINQMIDINLKGVIYCTKAVLPSMIKNKFGYIINISSISGKVGKPFLGGYAASKFGVVGFNESIHAELKKYGIKVSVICPGKINTPIHGIHLKKLDPKKMLDPFDIAEIALFLVTRSTRVYIKEISVLPIDQKN